jgi:multiple sugar transport system ATP-binding protein
MTAHLELSAVRKVFRGKSDVVAVENFELTIDSGELVGLLGPSGCGKSTTLRMIAGLEEPTSGDIRVDGRSVKGLSARRRNIGIAFENYALYPPLSVRENIAFGLDARKAGSARERKARVEELAERLDLTGLLDARPAGLSSGQKQRVALARAIARQPDVLLLDEPLSHLDAGQRDVTRRELRRLQRELGYTTVLVTHDQEEALSLADRVVVMNDGSIRQVGTPDQIYDDPADLFVASFVGEPAMNLITDGETTIGVRPEDITLTLRTDTDAETADMSGSVVVVEDFAEYALVTVEIREPLRRVVVQTGSAPHIRPGANVGLRFHPDRTYRFDTQTGNRTA